LGHRPWPNSKKLRIGVPKLDHAFDISLRKPLFLRQFILQIHGQPGNDARAPAFRFLPRSDQATDVPIHEDHLGIG
jgi:hypothetical protein